jgi:hypothetical protein
MASTVRLPERQYNCRIEELGPTAKLAFAQYTKYRDDFTEVSTDFGDAFDANFTTKLLKFEALVPSHQRQMTAAEETRRLNAAAKALRDPLNRLDIQIGKADQLKTLTVAAKDMGLSAVRAAINNRNIEGLDNALGGLIKLIETNQPALTDRGMKAQALTDLRTARTSLGLSNTEQDSGRLESVELTAENIKAANDLWTDVAEILRVGKLLYKVTNKKRAQAFTMARLLKLMRAANAGGAADGGEGEQPA